MYFSCLSVKVNENQKLFKNYTKQNALKEKKILLMELDFVACFLVT